MNLVRNTTLVLGGTSGIGAQIAEDLRLAGDKVETPGIYELDVRNNFDVRYYLAEHHPFNRIVYSAGVNRLMPIGAISTDPLNEIFRVNVMGFIRVLDAWVALEQSRRQEESSLPRSVVAIVSDSATTPMRTSIAYASSKAALAHAVRCAARELAPWCRVNGVSPSTVENTPMTESVDHQVPVVRGWTPEQARAYEKSLVPMGRRCTKEEVSRLARSVLDGPEFLTGAVIPLAGGKA